MPTTVISLDGKSIDEVEAMSGLVYVGRAEPRSKHKCAHVTSVWANRFKPKNYPGLTRAERTAACVEAYRQDLLTKPALLARLPELRGKVLACWCCDWPGHGEPPPPVMPWCWREWPMGWRRTNARSRRRPIMPNALLRYRTP
jgi:hypothetical protein